MNLEEMKARLAELIEELRAMHEEAGDAALSEERQADWDAKAEERATLTEQIKKAEARIKLVGDLAEAGVKEKGTDSGPAFHRDHSDVMYDLDAIRMESGSAEDYADRCADMAKRAIEKGSYGVRNKEAAQTYAEELLDEVDNRSGDLAKRMIATGSKEYERAFTKLMRHGNDSLCTAEERQALIRANQHLGTDSEGGFAVPFQLDPTVILTSAGVVNPIRNLARVERIVGKEWQGVTSSGVSVVRGSETTVAPDTQFTLAQPTVRTNRVQGFVQFSMEIDLSWGALRSEITKMLVDAKGREEESFTTGDGTGTNPGGLNGTLTVSQDVEVATAGAFVEADLYSLEEALDARWEPNASWLAHKTVYNKIRQMSPNGPGSSFWVSLGNGTPPRLLDYPDYRSTALPTVASAQASATHSDGTDTLMIFGDFSQFLIVDRIGMNVEMVPHVFDPTTARPTGNRGVYAVWMNNSKILVPNAFRRLIDGT